MLKSGKDDTYVRVTITRHIICKETKHNLFELEMMMTIFYFELIEEFDSWIWHDNSVLRKALKNVDVTYTDECT